MDREIIRLLVVEDCTILAFAYKKILETEISERYEYKIDLVEDCDKVIRLVKEGRIEEYDLILLDLRLPESVNRLYSCGEDLAVFIKSAHSKIKIIIITSVSHRSRILNVYNTIKPEGFLLKHEIEPNNFLGALEKVLEGKTFMSKTVEQYIEKITLNDTLIDIYDQKILFYLSMGEKTKNIPKYVPLSLRAIEMRKSKLKILLCSNGNQDSSLIREAKNRGII